MLRAATAIAGAFWKDDRGLPLVPSCKVSCGNVGASRAVCQQMIPLIRNLLGQPTEDAGVGEYVEEALTLRRSDERGRLPMWRGRVNYSRMLGGNLDGERCV